MNPTQPKSKEQLRADAEALFADLLAEPKTSGKVKNISAKPKLDKSWGTAGIVRKLITQRKLLPALRIVTVTTQHCSTCGSSHSYTGVAHIRFEDNKRPDHLAVELPYALTLEEAIATPSTVRHVEETTEVCATCLSMTEHIEHILFPEGADDSFKSLQMELFK